MAISGSNLTTGYNETTGTSWNTASVSPSNNALIIVTVNINFTTSGLNPTITVSGNGLTWHRIASVNLNVGGSYTGTVTGAMFWAIGSPSAGVITINSNTTADNGVAWSVDQFTGMDTTAPIRQNVTATGLSSAMTATLAALQSSSSATFGGFAASNPNIAYTFTKGGSFTQLGNVVSPTLFDGVLTEYTLNVTTVNGTNSDATNTNWVEIAIEIIPPAGGGAWNPGIGGSWIDDGLNQYNCDSRVHFDVEINRDTGNPMVMHWIAPWYDTISDQRSTDSNVSALLNSPGASGSEFYVAWFTPPPTWDPSAGGTWDWAGGHDQHYHEAIKALREDLDSYFITNWPFIPPPNWNPAVGGTWDWNGSNQDTFLEHWFSDSDVNAEFFQVGSVYPALIIPVPPTPPAPPPDYSYLFSLMPDVMLLDFAVNSVLVSWPMFLDTESLQEIQNRLNNKYRNNIWLSFYLGLKRSEFPAFDQACTNFGL